MGHLYSYWRHHFDIYKYIDLQTLSTLYSFLLIYFYLICCCKRRNIWASGFFFFLSLGLLYLDFFGLCVCMSCRILYYYEILRVLSKLHKKFKQFISFQKAIHKIYGIFLLSGHLFLFWAIHIISLDPVCVPTRKRLLSYFPCLLFLLQSYVVCYVYQAILQ